MYSDGLQPVIRQIWANGTLGKWTRSGSNVAYYKDTLARRDGCGGGSGEKRYILSFDLVFPEFGNDDRGSYYSFGKRSSLIRL